jgi:hypothetical protein
MITLTAIVVAFTLGSLLISAWNKAADKQSAKANAEHPLEQN